MRRYSVWLVLLWLWPLPVSAQALALPNGTIAIGYRHKEEGKVGTAVHRMELSCWDDKCTMTTLTLNQCTSVPDGEAFYPTVEHTATVEGTLVVRRSGAAVLSIEETYDGTEFRYRFGFRARQDSSLARRLNLQQATFFDAVTEFSGSATRDTPTAKHELSWELVPLRRGQELVRMKCAVYVEAIR